MGTACYVMIITKVLMEVTPCKRYSFLGFFSQAEKERSGTRAPAELSDPTSSLREERSSAPLPDLSKDHRVGGPR